MATEAQRRATAKYDAEHAKQYHLKLNKKTDADMIEWISKQGKFQTYVKKLIDQDMKKGGE